MNTPAKCSRTSFSSFILTVWQFATRTYVCPFPAICTYSNWENRYTGYRIRVASSFLCLKDLLKVTEILWALPCKPHTTRSWAQEPTMTKILKLSVFRTDFKTMKLEVEKDSSRRYQCISKLLNTQSHTHHIHTWSVLCVTTEDKHRRECFKY